MYYNELGKIAEKCWREIPKHIEGCELSDYVIMPDHIHGIIRITSIQNVRNRHACSQTDDNQVHEKYVCSQFHAKCSDNTINSLFDSSCQYRHAQILPKAVGSFKSATSRLIHKLGYWEFKWQKS